MKTNIENGIHLENIKNYNTELWDLLIEKHGDGYICPIIHTKYSVMFNKDINNKSFVIIWEKTMYSDFDNETDWLYSLKELLIAIEYDNLWKIK